MSIESLPAVDDAERRGPDPVAQIERWRSPLVAIALAGLAFALVSGSVLLFLGSFVERRDYWSLVH